MPKVYITDNYHSDGIHHISTRHDVVKPGDPSLKDWPVDAEVLMVRSDKISRDDLLRSKKLRLIVKQGVGVDSIDLEACKEKNIAVYNTPGLNSQAVAEFSISITLAVARRVCELDRRIRNGELLVRSNFLGLSLHRKTVGVVGMGNIGKEVAKIWRAAFQTDIIAYDPYAGDDVWRDIPHQRVTDLNLLLQVCDIITLHVPLTDTTKNMISTSELKLMKSSVILVNASRGGVINEEALFQALENKLIFGAAVDAFALEEPPTTKCYSKWMGLDNVVITPHVGSGTVENQSQSSIAVAQVIIDVLDGKAVKSRVA